MCIDKISNTGTFQAGAGLEEEVTKSFLSLVPETHQFHDVLSKIYRKKIKRAKVGPFSQIGRDTVGIKDLPRKIHLSPILAQKVVT